MCAVPIRPPGPPDHRARVRARGFTLVEIVSVLVAIGVLAGIGYPTLRGAITRSHDGAATATMHTVLTAVDTHRSSRIGPGGTYTTEDFESAASATLEFVDGPSTRYAQVSVRIGDGAVTAALAMRSGSGRCVYGVLGGFADRVWLVGPDQPCDGHAAGENLAGWGPISSPEAHLDDTHEDLAASGQARLAQPGQLLLSTSADGAQTVGSVQLPGIGDVATGTATRHPDATVTVPLTFTPETGYTGTYTVWLAARDTAGNVSESVPVTANVWPVAPATAPAGTLADTIEQVPVTATFTSDGDHRDFAFEAAAPGGGPWGTDVILPDIGVVSVGGTTKPEPGRLAADVTFTSAGNYVGPVEFELRVTDAADAKTSPASTITLEVGCNRELSHPIAHECAAASHVALYANVFSLSNNTTIYGDLLTHSSVTVGNNATLRDNPDGPGTGSIYGGAVTVTNGSQTVVDGDMWLHGDLTNNSPSTTVSGNVRLWDGSVSSPAKLAVGGQVRVNTPGTVTGKVSATGGVQVGDGLVAEPPDTRLPVFDPTRVTFDQTFATWADAQAWWSANSDRLGTAGRETIRVTDPSAGTLPTAGQLDGDLLLVSDGPTTFSGWPTATVGSTLTIIATATGTDALVNASSGASPSHMRTTLFTPGTITFTQQASLYGQVLAESVSTSNQLTLYGREPAYWAGRVLVTAGR